MVTKSRGSEILLFGLLMIGAYLTSNSLAVALSLDQWGVLGLVITMAMPVLAVYWIWEIKYKRRK